MSDDLKGEELVSCPKCNMHGLPRHRIPKRLLSGTHQGCKRVLNGRINRRHPANANR